MGLHSWEDCIHFKSGAQASDGPIKPFYGKENSHYLNRLGGRAGGVSLSIKYSLALNRIMFCLGYNVFSLCFLLWSISKNFQGNVKTLFSCACLPPLPGCQGTEPFIPTMARSWLKQKKQYLLYWSLKQNIKSTLIIYGSCYEKS